MINRVFHISVQSGGQLYNYKFYVSPIIGDLQLVLFKA